MADERSPRTDLEQYLVNRFLEEALAQAAETLRDPAPVQAALIVAARNEEEKQPALVAQVLDHGGQGAEILREFTATMKHISELLRTEAVTTAIAFPEESRDAEHGLDGLLRLSPIETPDETLKRAAEPEIVNEILAGGAVAASFTAAASVAKAKMEATTQRRKHDLDAETERLRIESTERIAGFQAMTGKVETEGPGIDEA
ncbi:hypothetical protein ACFQ93_30080 [Streptomyces sp. NPDC056601]|uniref:hypothetical protein n=1 Tax=Streptomyces sp. NPDC056601 TaxID=3345875 RepID=UPI0036C85657